ncbi:MAG: hypothetical protein QNJ70_08310 [Xenococcaceae cyanobacterium MO_207.B15]|nr:hypothetical protein [Xenococcaceae cyanobacterium MO_207.B15]
MFVIKYKYKKIINLSVGFSGGSTFLIGKTIRTQAFNIAFDYTYDTNNFFSDQTRKDALEEAASYYETYISDTFEAIEYNTASETGVGYDWSMGSGFINTWTASFFHPATGNEVQLVNNSINDFYVAADTITIFAGGRNLSGSTLGEGGTGGVGYSTIFDGEGNVLNQDFINLVTARGETGALDANPTDIGLWGGSITFDNDGVIDTGTETISYNWHYDTSTEPASDEVDFLSVAIHELGHVLGFGGSSWQTNVSNGEFTGTNAVNSYGSNVPLSDPAHWLDGITSTAIDGTLNQEVSLDPSITIGTRKILTELDYSGLADIGWEVSQNALNVQPIPFEFSPGLGILLMCGVFGSLKARNAWNNRK